MFQTRETATGKARSPYYVDSGQPRTVHNQRWSPVHSRPSIVIDLFTYFPGFICWTFVFEVYFTSDPLRIAARHRTAPHPATRGVPRRAAPEPV